MYSPSTRFSDSQLEERGALYAAKQLVFICSKVRKIVRGHILANLKLSKVAKESGLRREDEASHLRVQLGWRWCARKMLLASGGSRVCTILMLLH